MNFLYNSSDYFLLDKILINRNIIIIKDLTLKLIFLIVYKLVVGINFWELKFYDKFLSEGNNF
jgi:hypothetical protein